MSTILRHMLSFARPGRGDELRARMLAVAEGMGNVPGCELYVVSAVDGEPDAVAVTERWASAEASEAALDVAREAGEVDAVVALMDPDRPPLRHDLTPLGGVGHLEAPAAGWTKHALADSTDMAPTIGAGEACEARFAGDDLGLTRTGVAHHRVRPDRRQPFRHRHANAEELFVVLSGGGDARVDGETVPLTAGDALRVGPRVVRDFGAGPDGLELLAVGPRHAGDGEMLGPDAD
ncbi:MAG: cupin domain-containing protein [Solirubrobacteraceae bacterium]|nr:cupin domain-containing protein [Solirubrobacteraceae bacterium]